MFLLLLFQLRRPALLFLLYVLGFQNSQRATLCSSLEGFGTNGPQKREQGKGRAQNGL